MTSLTQNRPIRVSADDNYYVPGQKKLYVGSKKRSRLRQPMITGFENCSNEHRLKQLLLLNYDKTTRPVRDDNTVTQLVVGMSLFHILDTVSGVIIVMCT